MQQKARLDQIALDIEFLLISVVQGVALAALAANAALPIGHLEWQQFPYIASAFLLILTFWSQAIIHATSFIDWPLDISHNFLYFLASFVEVMVFSHMGDPLRWFGFVSAFLLVASILYVVDLMLIQQHKKQFEKTAAQKKLYEHMVHRQIFELKVYVPLALIYNFTAFLCIWLFPEIFLKQQMHLALVSVQLLFSGIVLRDSMKSFKKRSHLIGKIEKL